MNETSNILGKLREFTIKLGDLENFFDNQNLLEIGNMQITNFFNINIGDFFRTKETLERMNKKVTIITTKLQEIIEYAQKTTETIKKMG